MSSEVTITIKGDTTLVKLRTDNGIVIISQEEAEKRLIEEAGQFAIAELITRHNQELERITEKETKELYKHRIIPWNEQEAKEDAVD